MLSFLPVLRFPPVLHFLPVLRVLLRPPLPSLQPSIIAPTRAVFATIPFCDLTVYLIHYRDPNTT